METKKTIGQMSSGVFYDTLSRSLRRCYSRTCTCSLLDSESGGGEDYASFADLDSKMNERVHLRCGDDGQPTQFGEDISPEELRWRFVSEQVPVRGGNFTAFVGLFCLRTVLLVYVSIPIPIFRISRGSLRLLLEMLVLISY